MEHIRLIAASLAVPLVPSVSSPKTWMAGQGPGLRFKLVGGCQEKGMSPDITPLAIHRSECIERSLWSPGFPFCRNEMSQVPVVLWYLQGPLAKMTMGRRACPSGCAWRRGLKNDGEAMWSPPPKLT